MAFGEPYKYVQLNPQNESKWDEAVTKANDRFSNEDHNLFL